MSTIMSQSTEKEALSFENLRIFKDNSRFWTQCMGNSLFIFDQHISHLYRITDQLKELILAENAEDFERIKAGFPDEIIEENAEFVTGILNIPDEPAGMERTRNSISTLKLNISSRCNLMCSYCFREKEEDFIIEDKNLIYKAIDYLVYDCGRDMDSYTICYNLASEPLMQYELMEEIYKYIKKVRNKTGKKIELFFITNGTILDDKIIKLLKKVKKNRSLSISIDGPKEVHDKLRKYRNGAGTYDLIRRNLGILHKKGFKYAAEAVLSKNNPYPLLILQHLLDLGFDSVNIKPIRQGTEYSFDLSSLELLKKGYSAYFAYITEQLIERRNTSILEILSKDYALRPFWRILFNHKMDARCMWGINTISMDHKGDLYPCDSIMGNEQYKVGNIKEGINWEKFHQDLSSETRGECGKCWARNVCAGTCPVNGVILENDLLAIDPVECALTRFLIEKNLLLICNLINHDINLNLIKNIMGYNLYRIYLSK